jgi:hypothetical protein
MKACRQSVSNECSDAVVQWKSKLVQPHDSTISLSRLRNERFAFNEEMAALESLDKGTDTTSSVMTMRLDEAPY